MLSETEAMMSNVVAALSEGSRTKVEPAVCADAGGLVHTGAPLADMGVGEPG